MQVLHAEAHLDKELPYLALTQVFAHLSLQVLTQIAILAQFHHNVQFVPGLKRIIKSDDVRIVQLVHKERLSKRFLLLLTSHAGEVYLLHDVHSTVFL